MMSKKLAWPVWVGVSIVATGCVAPSVYRGPPPPLSRMPFPEAEYAALNKVGTATVRGQAFLKTRGGDVKTAAGNPVYLNPVTSYSNEWYSRSYLTGQRMEPPDPRLTPYMPNQTADGSGRFTFSNVPAGEYYVTSLVTWEAATGYKFSMETQGGIVTKKITVKDGETVEVIVTR